MKYKHKITGNVIDVSCDLNGTDWIKLGETPEIEAENETEKTVEEEMEIKEAPRRRAKRSKRK